MWKLIDFDFDKYPQNNKKCGYFSKYNIDDFF